MRKVSLVTFMVAAGLASGCADPSAPLPPGQTGNRTERITVEPVLASSLPPPQRTSLARPADRPVQEPIILRPAALRRQIGPALVDQRSIEARDMMRLPDGTKAKTNYLRKACRAGDGTACILSEANHTMPRRVALQLY